MEPRSRSHFFLGSWIRPRSPTARLTELLAMYSAIKHFAYFLEGRKFRIYTDHKPLTFALASSSERWTPRQQRHLSFIAEYTADLRHVRGRDNAVADVLSRVDISINPVARMTEPSSLDLLKMTRAQAADAEVQAYRTAITQLVLADLPIPGHHYLIVRHLHWNCQACCSFLMATGSVDAIHGFAHPGIGTSRKMVAACFVWHGMN